MSAVKFSVCALFALATSPALAQEEVRGGSPGNSGGDLVQPGNSGGDPVRGDDSSPGNSGDSNGVGQLFEPGPPDETIQLADGTAGIFDLEGGLFGHVLTATSGIPGLDKMETWVFESGQLYGTPGPFDVLVNSSASDISQLGGKGISAYWEGVLTEAEKDGWQVVCLGVNYVNPVTYKGQPEAVITDLDNPDLTSYELVKNDTVVAWLLRGQDAQGNIGEVYGFVDGYQPPAVGETLEFTPLTGGEAFTNVNDYFDFLFSQDLHNKQGLGLASYTAPEAVTTGTWCD